MGGHLVKLQRATTKMCSIKLAPPTNINCNTLILSGPAVCEKTFSASFVPQPAENTTYNARKLNIISNYYNL